nr:reverse transcriptase domain-containing protein [Tanacetum cinerariifolium]
MKSIQTFLEEFHCIPLEEKPTILLQAWFIFFAFKHDQLENSNELFQKLLEDLKELAKYKESLENSSNEIATSSFNQEKEELPQDSDIRQLIREECCIKIFCMHDNVDDLIESALNSKLLSINSQRFDKKEQEVKNVVEQPAEHRTRGEKSLQNFRVIHKSSISLNNTSQISPVHAIAPILSTEEPEHSFSMGYEHFSTTLVTELDKVAESSIKNLVPIPRECEVTSEDESKCDMPIQDQYFSVFTTFSNPLFKDNDDLNSSDDESLSEEDVPIEESKVFSNSLFNDDEINSNELESHVESNFVESSSNHDALIDSSQNIDYLEDFSDELAHINPEIPESDFNCEQEIHLIENLFRMEMLFTINPRPRPTVNANTNVESIFSSLIPIQDNESQREEIDIVTNTDDGAPECMRISGFMHGVNNPESTKRLNEHVPKTMKEMMIPTTAFIRGEAAAAS